MATPKKHINAGIDVTITTYTLPNGIFHRDDGPAFIEENHDGTYMEEWYNRNKYHRIGGPAVTYRDGSHGYWIYDRDVNDDVKPWLESRNYAWDNMSDIEKWELEIFMKSL